MEISALVTIFVSLFTFFLAFNVGKTRAKLKIPAYTQSDNPELQKAIRVHMNMVESLVVFLPLLWVASVFGHPMIAGVVGAFWFATRVWYSYAYLQDPAKRTIPFMLGLLSLIVLVGIGIVGIIM